MFELAVASAGMWMIANSNWRYTYFLHFMFKNFITSYIHNQNYSMHQHTYSELKLYICMHAYMSIKYFGS